MADTSVTYVGDGSTVAFNVPFLYIQESHVVVELNSVIRLDPSDYWFTSATQITFAVAPAVDDGILIRRVTPGDTRLIDFTNGSVLTEADLDLAVDQVFYLAQEAKENFSDLVYQEMVRIGTATGITSTDPTTWLASAVDTMLATPAASALQAGLSDIATNAESFLDHADLLQLIGDANVGRTAFTLDETTVLVDGGGQTLAAKFLAIIATGDATVAAITLLGVINGAETAFILDTSTVKIDSDGGNTLGTAFARNAIQLDVNGYITGYEQINDGTSGSFIIMADEFAVIEPGSTSGAGTAPFSISSGIVSMQNVIITGSLVVNGTITSDELTGSNLADLYTDMGALTAGSIVLDTSGFIRGGQTAYNTGDGFFLGYDTADYKFSIGNGADNRLTWDGTTLTVKGDLFVGEYTASANTLLTAATTRTSSAQSWVELKAFTIDRAGTVRVSISDGEFHSGTVITNAQLRILVDGVVDTTYNIIGGYAVTTTDVTVVADSEITIEVFGGVEDSGGFNNYAGQIKDCLIQADVALTADGGTVDTD